MDPPSPAQCKRVAENEKGYGGQATNINREWTRMNANNGWLRMRLRLVLKALGVVGRGYGRFCREAAIQNSPGLQPWVGRIKARALKVAPEVGAIDGLNALLPDHTPRPPLSGRFNASSNPGLKPWDVVCNRCAVRSVREYCGVKGRSTSCASRNTPTLHYSMTPFATIRGQGGLRRSRFA
jgi:hypothetical protein